MQDLLVREATLLYFFICPSTSHLSTPDGTCQLSIVELILKTQLKKKKHKSRLSPIPMSLLYFLFSLLRITLKITFLPNPERCLHKAYKKGTGVLVLTHF